MPIKLGTVNSVIPSFWKNSVRKLKKNSVNSVIRRKILANKYSYFTSNNYEMEPKLLMVSHPERAVGLSSIF